MLKSVLSIILGIVIGGVAIMAMEMLGHSLYPPPAGIDFNDPAQVAEMVANAPVAALLMVILAYVVGGIVAGFICGLLKPKTQNYQPFVVGVILTFFGLMNLLMIPHPIWFWISTLIAFVPTALLGNKLSAGMKK